MTQLGPYSIQMLNVAEMIKLQPKAATSDAKKKNAEPARNELTKGLPFLMVLQNAEQELFGIAVDAPPDLIDIANSELRAIPAKRRLDDSLRWVSHLVSYDSDQDHQTLLLLDLSSILEPEQQAVEDLELLSIDPPLALSGTQ